jgi:eukaryotic-like serine/threonine-protein kinase
MDVEKMGEPSTGRSEGPNELGRGDCVGRYLIVGLIGKGGMGEVYAAYDPELDRKIALKLLRARTVAGVDPSEGRGRLLREAQAIARLSDPNVVVVFDVGTFGDRVFLAMEFVDGNTLGYWLQAKTRTWREIVATFIAAGRGLACAHRAGVVHRDFKPDNVMIGRDGKVRVMDFGLARTIDSGMADNPLDKPTRAEATPPPGDNGPAPLPDSMRSTSASNADRASTAAASISNKQVGLPVPGIAFAVTSGGGPGAWTEADTATRDLSKDVAANRTSFPPSPLNAPLTVTGAMMGTPAYMAPEQFQGGSIDPRTDQFSFCVAVYEGLYGERPFSGKTIHELSENVQAGRVRQPPAQPRVPGWLRRVVLRGMRVDREQRYPSMEVLLATLARDPARTRRRWAAGGTVAALIVVLGVGLVRAQQQQRMKCLGAEAKLAGIWEVPNGKGLSPRKESIRRAFLATKKRYAADSFTVVMNALDRYVIEWNTMHRDSCEATNIRGEQSAEVLDLRTSCLHDRFNEVRALTGVLSDANAEVVTKSVEAAQALRPVEQCADIAALRAVVRPPDDPAARRAVADVRTQLSDVKALVTGGRYKSAAKDVARVVEDARRTKYAPVIAEALLELGELQLLGNDAKLAEKSYEEAVWVAEGSRHDEVVLEAAAQLIANIGFSQHRHQEAEHWALFAGAVLRRLGPGHDMLAAWRANNLALVYFAEGRLEDALAMVREAVATKTRAVGEEHFDVAVSLTNEAYLLHELGRTDEAIEKNQRAIEIFRKTLGPDHPRVANPLVNGSEFMNARGRYVEAQAMAEQALTIMERELDWDQQEFAVAFTAIGLSWIGRGKPTLAIPVLEKALLIRETGDPDPVRLGETRFALARALWESDHSSMRAILLAEKAQGDFENNSRTTNRKVDVANWIDSHKVSGAHISMR